MKARGLALPGAALAAVLVLLGVQLAFGGADYKPAKVASACVERALGPAGESLDQVTQEIVLDGVQSAACKLGVTRERLLLALPSAADRSTLLRGTGRTEAQLEADLKAGMQRSIVRNDQAKRLPTAAALLETYADQLGLPPLAVTAIKQVPDSVVNGFLPTAGVLQRAISGLDFAALLADLGSNPDALEPALRAAITDAALAEARSQIQDQLPDQIKQLIGLG